MSIGWPIRTGLIALALCAGAILLLDRLFPPDLSRIETVGTEVTDRQWVIHWHTPSAFRRLCERAGLEVERLSDDDTGMPTSKATVSFTAILRRR